MISKKLICTILIILFHAVGLYGFLTPALTPLFIQLVPFHLLLMLVLLVISQTDTQKKIRMFLLLAYVLGFGVEVLGVNTGMIFGNYTYGETLGFKLAGTPVLIGVNWVILVLCTGVLVQKFKIKSLPIRSVIGAFILAGIDLLIEPVAIKYDYWHWLNNAIPFQNYIAWFIFSCFLLYLFFLLDFKKDNPAALVLLFAQLVFFSVLNSWIF
jgi:bisanhydrobacterioruberin hydratase